MGRLPQTNTSVSRYLRQQKRVVTRLANSTPYALSGTSVVGPGLTTVDERLVAGTPGGSRVELDSAGLRKYAADGTTVQVDLTGDVAAFSGLITGSEIIGGEIKTAASGNRVMITPDGVEGGEVRLYTGHADEIDPASIWVYGAPGSVGFEVGQLFIYPPKLGSRPSGYLYFENGKHDTDSGLDYTKAALDSQYIELGSSSGVLTDEIVLKSAVLYRHLAMAEVLRGDFAGDEWAALRFITVDSSKTVDEAGSLARLLLRVAPTVAAPLLVWDTNATPGAELRYTTNGTTWTVIGGGGGGTTLFADPGADQLVFWDDSAGAFAALTPYTGLEIIGGTYLTTRVATDAQSGRVELATPAETITGTDGLRATTPAGVKAAINATGASTGVSYSAGWADYGGAFSPATWYRDKDGFIRLSGLLKRTGSTITNAASGTIFTLPVGARPAGNETFIMNKGGEVVFCSVGSDGIVQVAYVGTWTGGASFMYLGGCQFKAA